MSLITIQKSHNVSDLFILKSSLEHDGIKCFLLNEFTTQIMSHVGSFEVELQVHAADIDRMKEILAEVN
ncbi:putative signal transducing protein [Polaribacter atrinae]|uniref:putative signal transducing protein n=1 Tax=Polaribacter atrinae TaxID=1333662 RepID=UPI0030F94A14